MGNAGVTSFPTARVIGLRDRWLRLPEPNAFAAGVYSSQPTTGNGMIAVHAVFPLRPEERDEALDLIGDLAEKSRAEPGVIDYRPATDVDDPNVVRCFEQ